MLIFNRLKFLSLFFACLFFCFSNPVFAEDLSAKTAVQSFLEKAKELHLSSDSEWQKILFYQRKYFTGRRGLVDAPEFYLSQQGKYDPEKELNATLNAFFSGVQGDKSAQCKFPLRLKWLKSKLDNETIQIPTQACARFDDWLNMINPKGVVFVFSSFYINNPSSMFGHTFFRIESSNHALTDYGVNFAADTNTNNLFAYTYRGLVGGFQGRFSLLPYYFKVQEYSNSESRDLWEYELNLSSDQIDNMMRSLWEVGDNWIDYYYLDENCSYVLLALLDNASQDFHFADQFFSFVNPPDTLRVVNNYPGLVKNKIFRASAEKRFRARYEVLSSSERDFFTKVIDNNIKPDELKDQIPREGAARVLTAVSEYIDYREHIAGTEDSRKYPIFRKEVLNARAKLQIITPPLDIRPTEEDRPENGVWGSRMGSFYSHSNATQSALDYELRPVLHDLQSPPIGYSKDSQIEFINTSVRYETSSKSLYLNRVSLLKIKSIPPFYAPFYPISWTFEMTMEQDSDCQTGFYNPACRRYFVGGGTGFSVAHGFGPVSLQMYALPITQLGYMGEFGAEVILGIESGLITTLQRKYVLYTSAQWSKRYSISQSQWRDHLSLDTSFAVPLFRQFEGRIQYNHNFQTDVWRFGAGIYWYFF